MKRTIEEHFKNNLKSYLAISVFFILGLIIGISSINNMKTEQKTELTSYFENFINETKNNTNINYTTLLDNSIKNNLKFIALIVILSFSIWGEVSTCALMGYRGFSLGYTISSAITILGIGKGMCFAVSLMLFSEIIYIPAIFFISIFSIKKYKELIDKEYENKKTLIARYLIALFITTICAIFSSFMKTYFNTNLFLMFAKYF